MIHRVGEKTLADLFEGKSQLIVCHFVFGPESQEGSPSCSFGMDHADPTLTHLVQRDVAFVVVKSACGEDRTFKKRMGWRFNWVSSNDNDFNHGYAVSFTTEELARSDIYNFEAIDHPNVEAPGYKLGRRASSFS